MGSLQDMDCVSLMKPITKFSATVYETERIPEYLAIALREAYSGRPGPSFLEIPNDVLDKEVDEETVPFFVGYRSKSRNRASSRDIEKAAELLGKLDGIAERFFGCF